MLEAEDILAERRDELPPPVVRALTLVATGSERAADRAYTAAVSADLRRGRVPRV